MLCPGKPGMGDTSLSLGLPYDHLTQREGSGPICGFRPMHPPSPQKAAPSVGKADLPTQPILLRCYSLGSKPYSPRLQRRMSLEHSVITDCVVLAVIMQKDQCVSRKALSHLESNDRPHPQHTNTLTQTDTEIYRHNLTTPPACTH